MIPGTAIGVLIGDLYSWYAFKLSKRGKRELGADGRMPLPAHQQRHHANRGQHALRLRMPGSP